MNVSSLWIGSQLSVPHKIALSSFLHYGHKVKLYVYDQSIEVPNGVIKEDANNILSSKRIFIHHNQYAAFSDIFRYYMIKQTGEFWIDTDSFCFSEDFFEKNEYVFVEEAKDEYCGNLLKVPQNSDFINWLCESAEKKLDDKNKNGIQITDEASHWKSWSFIGPGLLTEGIELFGLKEFAISREEGHLIDIRKEDPSDLFYNPERLDEFLSRIENATSGSFFNSVFKHKNIDKNILINGSAMDFLSKKYLYK